MLKNKKEVLLILVAAMVLAAGAIWYLQFRPGAGCKTTQLKLEDGQTVTRNTCDQ